MSFEYFIYCNFICLDLSMFVILAAFSRFIYRLCIAMYFHHKNIKHHKPVYYTYIHMYILIFHTHRSAWISGDQPSSSPGQ